MHSAGACEKAPSQGSSKEIFGFAARRPRPLGNRVGSLEVSAFLSCTNYSSYTLESTKSQLFEAN